MSRPTRVRALRTVALIKQVPRGGQAELGVDGRLVRSGATAEINPWCRRALAYAVRLAQETGGSSVAVTMGPPSAADVLREALACGATSARHVCDPALAGADCLITSRALVAAVRDLGSPDLVLVGRSTIDSATAASGVMIAEELGLPFIGPALTLEVRGHGADLVATATLQRGGTTDTVEVTLPAVVAVAERSIQPAKAAPDTWPDGPGLIRTIGLGELIGCPTGAESPTRVVGVRAVGTGARRPVVLTGPVGSSVRAAADLVRERLRTAAEPAAPAPVAPARGMGGPAVLAVVEDPMSAVATRLLASAADVAAEVGGHVVALSADPAVRRCARFGADAVVVLRVGDLAGAVSAAERLVADRGMPWAVLGASRPTTQELLARLGSRLGAGLLADLVALRVEMHRGRLSLVGTKPAGDRTVADLVAVGPTQIATVRTGCLPAAEPRKAPRAVDLGELDCAPLPARVLRSVVEDTDVDALDRAAVVIGVGQGIAPVDYPALEGLRHLLSAELAATRKVTDQGWLPHARQVGITAHDIAPRLYLAIGLSGNDNHLAGVARAGTVLAVNHDPHAPVFARCDVGIVGDWVEVVPLLERELAGVPMIG